MSELARIGGVAAAPGVLLLLLTAGRAWRLLGLALVLTGGAFVAWPLAPNLSAPVLVAGITAGLVVSVGATWTLVRWPWLLPVLALACVPARFPVDLGGSTYNLLIPLYFLVTASTLVLAFELFRGDERVRELAPVAWPLALFIAWSALSLSWSSDVHEGSIELSAFLIPFTLLALSLARMSWTRRLLLWLCAELAAMALVFALIGIYQWLTRDVFWNPRVIFSNAYAPYFRVNSVFWDPSIYGRFLVVSLLALLVVALTSERRSIALGAAGAIGAIWIGLALSFSQSSFAALIVSTAIAALFVWRRRAVMPLALAAMLLAAAALGTPSVRQRLSDWSHGGLNDATQGRSALVSNGVRIALDHPLVGVGVGGFKRAYADRTGLKGRDPKKAASHTTPVTTAAETGAVGLAFYAWLIASLLVFGYRRAGRDFAGRVALTCSLVLTAIVTHSLFYSDFFEDPMTWGFLALVVSMPLTLGKGAGVPSSAGYK